MRLNNKNIFIALFLISFFLHAVTLIALYSVEPVNDAVEYVDIAKNLAQGNGYSVSKSYPFVPSAGRLPVYPFFLALFFKLFGPTTKIVLWFQVLIISGTSLLVYYTAKEISGFYAGIISFILFNLYPAMLVYPALYLTETLSVCFLFVSVFSFYKYLEMNNIKYLYLCVFTAFLLALSREIFIVLVPLYLLILFIYLRGHRNKIIKPLLIFIIAGLLFFSPWVIRNYLAFNRFIPLSNKGGIIFEYSHLVSKNLSLGMDLEEARKVVEQNTDAYPQKTFFQMITTKLYWKANLDRIMILLGVHPQVKYPVPLSGVTVKKYPFIRWLSLFVHFTILTTALIYLLCQRRHFTKASVTIYLAAFVTFCAYAMIHAIPRYQIHIISLLSFLSGPGIIFIVNVVKKNKSLN